MSTPYSAYSFTFHDSAMNPHADIWFAEPPGFTAIPLHSRSDPQGSPAHGELRAALGPLLESAPDDRCRQLLIGRFAAGQQLLAALGEVGTVHCSIGLHRDDGGDDAGSGWGGGGAEGQALLSLFTVSWRDIAVAPPAVTAARAVTSGEQFPHVRIEYLDDLLCGPATLSETVRTPVDGSGLPRRPLLQVHAHLPHPEGKRLAVLTLSTTAAHRRESYRLLLRQIAELVSFESPVAAS
ncbi:hypothetical protein [Streptomyces atriruber]|uniref:hypothetical protein n=1 Tax=Streptomyces atriruber TaxID=545121 RepID=UPI0006E25E03|nr:hypothetical protein [Streptomyces atriruber]